jgi:hypothetical protein
VRQRVTTTALGAALAATLGSLGAAQSAWDAGARAQVFAHVAALPALELSLSGLATDGLVGLGTYQDWNMQRDIRPAAACNVDVACPEGEGWELQTRSIVKIGAPLMDCTGVLLNNTSGDGTPYVLTASHCGDLSGSKFQFNFKRSGCGEGLPERTRDSVSGSTLLVADDLLDFQLVRLNLIPRPEIGAVYAGWDHSGEVPRGVATLHHPGGDVMKISRDHHKPKKQKFFWRIQKWEVGVTEEGSSGAPLFDSKRRVIGLLKGGPADCANPGGDLFPRFEFLWGLLLPYLDPIGSGAKTLDALDTREVEFSLEPVAFGPEGGIPVGSEKASVTGRGLTGQCRLFIDDLELPPRLIHYVTNSRLDVDVGRLGLAAGSYRLTVQRLHDKKDIDFQIVEAETPGGPR